MTSQLSQKLKNLSFLLMILVAFIHGYNLNINMGTAGNIKPSYWLQFFETFISDGVCRVAVPMFFGISGYLACVKIKENFTWNWYGNLLKKKVFSLLFPYLLVSGMGIVLVSVLQLIPFSRPFFNNFNIYTTSASQWLKTWLISPVPFQLWFLRFLIMYFLLLPFFYYFIKYFKILFLLPLLYFWAYVPWQIQTGIVKLELEGAFFFSLGMFFSIFDINPNNKVKIFSFFIFLFLWLVWIYYRTSSFIRIDFNPYLVHYHIIGITLSGLIVFWLAYDIFQISIEQSSWIKKNSKYAFGIFLFHEPVLTIIKKISIKLLGVSDYSLLSSYILSPLIAIYLALVLSKILEKYFLSLYLIITGSRSNKVNLPL